MSSTHFNLLDLGRSYRTGTVLCTKRRCTLCRTIRQCFYDRYGEIYNWTGVVRQERYRGGIRLTACYGSPYQGLLDNPGPSLFLFADTHRSGPKSWLKRHFRPRESPRLFYDSELPRILPSRVDSAMIDPNRVLQWMKKCELEHGERCRVPKDGNPKAPDSFRLIDIQQGCLVSGSFLDAYLAVSYVWGRSPVFKTTRCNLPWMEAPGSFKLLEGRLPATVADAMAFASAVGIRYIWVDALCIVQDDKESKHTQIQQMHQIYRNAYMTIVAAAGSDADAGLPGATVVRPRKIKQVVFQWAGFDFFVSQRPLESLLGETRIGASKQTSTWNTRAWTYQERIFSTRKLVFLDEGVHWNCNCVTWMEDIQDHSVNDGHYFQMFDFNPFTYHFPIGPDRPGLEKDSYCAGLFSNTNLDDYCTIVREYSMRQLTYQDDVLNALSGTLTALNLKGGYRFGTPRRYFWACMLWQPQDSVSRRSPVAPGNIKSKFPSWCWSGWIGPISTENWYLQETSDRHLTAFERYLAPAVPSLFPTAVFESFSDDVDEPCGNVATELARFGLERTTYLNNQQIHTASIKSSFGVDCGFVQLHNDSHPVFCQGAEKWRNRTQYDFISISRGEVAFRILKENCGPFLEWRGKSMYGLNGMYKYHNVLLLAWEGGIAYRAGLGRIDERVWKNSSPVTKVVRLG